MSDKARDLLALLIYISQIFRVNAPSSDVLGEKGRNLTAINMIEGTAPLAPPNGLQGHKQRKLLESIIRRHLSQRAYDHAEKDELYELYEGEMVVYNHQRVPTLLL